MKNAEPRRRYRSERRQTVYESGKAARERGWGFETNPFRPDDPLFKVWLEGWGGEDEGVRPDWGMRIILGLALLTSAALFGYLIKMSNMPG